MGATRRRRQHNQARRQPVRRSHGLKEKVQVFLQRLFVPCARRLSENLRHPARLHHDLGENLLAEGAVQFPHRARNQVFVLERRLVLRALLTAAELLARGASTTINSESSEKWRRPLSDFC